ncbi:unnamed protein product [Chrysodeixis includens]|uniref:Peptidoglycan-recognition protein n=1 Tax=Chrysodeixis includens TaxID=689277 RepID=A0A9P0BU10_CHRIL|nr:unnamed protein product [Chrysodeixis includens]
MLVELFILFCAWISAVVTMPGALKADESTDNEIQSYKFPFVSRAQWHARKPNKVELLPNPVPYVVIHHSYIPPACHDRKECCSAMKHMQNFHMDDREWWDIGYHFAVGSDGAAYEGRGWGVLGAHAKHFNHVSIGICLIGDWRYEVPPAEQLKTAQSLIKAGIELGYIKPEYKLVGHRQVRNTECPGEALFQEIKTWEHFSPYPHSYHDLLDVKEIPSFVKRMILNATVTP